MNLLIVDVGGDVKKGVPTRLDVIFWDLDQAGTNIRSVNLLSEQKQDLQDEFERINNCYDNADIIVAHGVRFDRPMVASIPAFRHWGVKEEKVKEKEKEKPWICTMEDFEWPGLESLRQAKLNLLRQTTTKRRTRAGQYAKGWLKLQEICECYKIPFKAKSGEHQLNHAELLLSCLIKVPDLQQRLSYTCTYE